MKATLVFALLVLGVVAVAAQIQQTGPSITVQGQGPVPSTIPRIPVPPSTPPPTVVVRPVTPEVIHAAEAAEQRQAIQVIQQLPEADRRRLIEELERRGIDLPEAERMIREGRLLPKQDDKTIFRVIKDELKPIPVGPGGLDPVFPATQHPWGRPLDSAEAARIVAAAASVGRIVTGPETQLLRGTGFVVAPGLVATNCHVLRQIGELQNGSLSLQKSARIDFSEGGVHNPDREFRIEGIAAYPAVPFLDVALLRVANTSIGGGNALPAPLTLRRTRLHVDPSSSAQLVAVIGYPNLLNVEAADRLTQYTYRRLRESGDRGKTLSLGAVTGVETHQGIDFLDHVASTHIGQSGSPVVDRATGEVLGVHYCCASPLAPPVIDPLPCSSQMLSDRENNEAVSTWTVVQDRSIGPLFGRVAYRIPVFELLLKPKH